MFSFLRRLFYRKPKPIDLFARTGGTEAWSLVGQYTTQDEATEAAQQHAATACFKSGHVVFFEFKFTPVVATETSL